MIFIFFQRRRIQAKNVGFIPEIVRLIWFWSQNSISSNKKWKNWQFLPRPILFNVNVWNSFRHFRLPVTSKTNLSARTRRFPITCKKPFDDISNLWPVIWSSDLGYLKKSYLSSILIYNNLLLGNQVLCMPPFVWVTALVELSGSAPTWET